MSRTSIASVKGRQVWDSRGRPAVEAEVTLRGGAAGRAIAPAGASTGSGEALDLRDGGTAFGGFGVERAVANVNGEIANALAGLDGARQETVDRALIELDGTDDKSRLGGNACIAVSMAVAQAAAATHKLPLWRYLLGGGEPVLPLPEVQIFGGGAHAGARIDLQDIMIVPVGADSFAQAMAWAAEVYRAAGQNMAERRRLTGVADEGGYWPNFKTNEDALAETVRAIERAGFRPGEQIALSLDIAATQLQKLGRYWLTIEDRCFERGPFGELLLDWAARFPIVSLEDPFAEDDTQGMTAFTEAAGGRLQIIGDDYLVTNAERVRAAARAGACNAVLIKPNQAGTLSETKAALDAGKEAGFATIASARSGESEDVGIVHLAVGWSAGQLKVGAFARSERMAKWNEALRIEEQCAGRSRFAGASVLAGR